MGLSPRALSSSRLGFRGGFLLVLAAYDFLYGASMLFPSDELLRSKATVWRDHIAPEWVWGSAWMVVGIVCLAASFMHQDRVGFGLQVGLLIFWAMMAVATQLWGGYSRGYVSAGTWTAILLLTMLASGQPERPRTVRPPEESR